MINISKYDKILEELKSNLFSERKMKKLNKINPNFYKDIHEILLELEDEKNSVLADTDIKKYMEITKLIDDLKKNFRAFFQVRFEKIARYSVYDITDDITENMTPEEKNIINEISLKLRDYYRDFADVKRFREPETEKPEEEIINKEEPVQGINNIEEAKKIENPVVNKSNKDELLLVRILENLPPIAQPDGDYYLHKNDILYLNKTFAEILHKRGALSYINIEKKETL